MFITFKQNLILSLLLLSIIFAQSSIQFSANILENIIENDIEKRVFRDTVIIKKDNMLLLTDEAIYIPSSGEVILNQNVKMYDNADSLVCNSLILYDGEYKKFTANEDVSFFKNNKIIKSNFLKYTEDQFNESVNINLFGNAQIIDSMRTVFGDSIYINYSNSIITNIKVISNAQVINSRFAKYTKDKKYQEFQDFISSKKMFINFDGGDIKEMILDGMASTKFNVIEDTLITGLSTSSGDSIYINIRNNNISRMQMFGGVEGTFKPEIENSKIDSTVIYKANHIDYQIDSERSYLYKNAMLTYDGNELNAGEIFIDWNNDLLEARVSDSILPSINGFGENPIFGQKMIFDLITKKGKIIKGETGINDSFYSGKTITKDNEELYYIQNSLFTTCDLEHPHYYFHSDQMKMIPNNRIIAKPMILYIQELPIFYLPFAVFPNKNGDRISGWIMPSFGHKSSTGTYLDNLGYYYVVDDYSDYTCLFDIQDKRGLIINHEYRYKRQSGNYWYNYYLDGYLDYENKYYLSENEEDISNLFNNDSSKIKNIHWKHQQSFDPTQHLIINYKYKSSLDAKEINLNNRLDQNQLTSLSYQKRWTRNSLSIGFEEYEDLYISNPNTIDDINVYKWFTGPRVNFSLPQRKIFGNGDRWFNDLYLSYNFSYDHGKETFTKQSCIENIENNCEDEDYILQESDNIIWSSDEIKNTKKGSAKNLLQFIMTNNLGWITLSPRINIYEDWARGYKNYNNEDANFEYLSGFNRRLTWNSSLTANTKIYGIIPVNLGKLISVRHKFSPQITLNYIPNLSKNYSNQIKEYELNETIIEYDILSESYVNSFSDERKKITFSLDNTFQAKLNDKENNLTKIDFLNINMTFDYDGNPIDGNEFSLIDSRWSFKKYNGGELFFIHMQHNMYDKENNKLLLKKGKLPNLEFLRFQMSSNYRLNGYSINQNSDDVDVSDSISDSTKYNSILFMDEYKPRIGNYEVWRSDLNISIQGDYDVDAKKIEFNYFNLDTYNTIHLTKNWLFTYATGINLMDMKIKSQSLKFYRELHCWEFMFTWWPDGYSKGFQLSINVKHPDLKYIRVRSSSTNRNFNSN
jgi:hypothetical protein